MKSSLLKSSVSPRALTLVTFLGAAIAPHGPLLAEDTPRCVESNAVDCRFNPAAGTSVNMPVGANTEIAEPWPAGDAAGPGFSIMIDEQVFAGTVQASAPQRLQDIALSDANVDVSFDGFAVLPRLGVATSDLSSSAAPGKLVTFVTSTNYPDYVAQAEIRVLDQTRRRSAPPIALLPVATGGRANWTMPSDGSGDYAYVLRVYDEAGRFNETRPVPLTRYSGDAERPAMNGSIIAPGEGEDMTAIRNFRVRGGAVTVSGEGMTTRQSVMVMGAPVLVDATGAFVTQRILPVGQHIVKVETGPDPGAGRLERDIEVPARDVFYVGLVDITLRKNETTYATGGQTRESSVNGRLALYFKGRYPGGSQVTASVDTGNGPIADAFRRLDGKDPLSLLQRLRDDTFYPVYGDDSIAFDDAPSRGRVYLKWENRRSSALWGDYDVDITGTTFLRDTRNLYGALITHESEATRQDGRPLLALKVYAAEGEAVARRDVLGGTGGSAYFLSHQDIEAGSETVSVEIVDARTGRVRKVRVLTAGIDYTIDPIQGVILLTQPLRRGVGDSGLVQTNPSGDDLSRLVVTYQQTSVNGRLSGGSVGGRVTWAPADALTLGATAARDTTGIDDHEVIGIDLRYDFGRESWLELEAARSEGPGFDSALSNDGGLVLDRLSGAGAADSSARAFRMDARFALADLGFANDGHVDLYAERIEGGFASRNQNVEVTQSLAGISGEYALSQSARLHFDAETFRKADGEESSEAEITVRQTRANGVTLDFGVGWEEQTQPGVPEESGSATYLLGRIGYQINADAEVYAFARQDIRSSGQLDPDPRYGAGGRAQLNDRLGVSGEVSDGSRGFGASVSLDWSPASGRDLYLTYSGGVGSAVGGAVSGRELVLGAKRRHSDRVSTYAEHVWRDGARERSLTRAYGVTYTPSDIWQFSGQIETGSVTDPVNGDFDRFAISASARYNDGEDVTGFLKLEYRDEEGAGTARDRETWLMSAAIDYQTHPSWHLLGTLDLVRSQAAEGDFRDGDYTRASIGYAYRPTEDDRTNGLVRLSYTDDQPGEDQVDANGSTDGDRQRSIVFSADVIHELTETLTIGAKYGYRHGETAPRGTDAFTENNAHLAILRLDWDVSHNWAVSLEGRRQWNETSGDVSRGGSIAVYRDVGNNVMVGVGYEAGSVSADLSDFSYEERGLFLNVIAKF